MESKRLKQRLARLFRTSFLRRSPCSYSTSTSSSSIFSSTAAGSTSSRRSVSTDIAVVEPVFLPRNADSSTVDIPPFLRGKLDRPVPTPGRPERRGGCRPARASSECNLEPASPTSPKKDYFYYNNNNNNKKNVRSKKKLLSNGYGFSSSSSDEGFELFSSGGEQYIVVDGEETETFFFSSCRSFSSDSSEFYNNSRRKKKNAEQNKKLSRRPPIRTRIRPNESCRPVASMADDVGESAGRATCGVPVTKRSRDPYVDFRDSMVEMMVERQIFATEGLEKLLHSYLSLNSSRHHPVILRAFGDIAQVLFGQ